MVICIPADAVSAIIASAIVVGIFVGGGWLVARLNRSSVKIEVLAMLVLFAVFITIAVASFAAWFS